MSKIKAAVLIILMSLFTVSCIDMDEPEPTAMDEQLSDYLLGAQYEMAVLLGSDFGKFPLLWMQQISGITGEPLQADRYKVDNTLFNDAWERYYMGILQRLRYMEYLAVENEAPVFEGLSLIMQAHMIGLVSDFWGDMPFSEADNYFVGTHGIKYDSQASLYDELLEFITKGINLLQYNDPGDILPIAEYDAFYGGSVQKWIKAAHLIRMKYSMRLAHRMDYYVMGFQYIQMGGLFTSVDDDMYFPFSGYDNVQNPWVDPPNIRVGKRFVDLMVETDDPRLQRFVRMTPGNEYIGVAAGTGNTNQNIAASRIENTANSIGSAASRLHILTYAEQKFIESELYYRMGNQAQADAAYKEAVEASLEMYNVRDAEWEAQHANKENVDLQEIITAKYQALFLNPEVWIDWRRTGFPTLSPAVTNENDDLIPRRFLYPQSELMNNQTNVPQDITLNSFVWWDTP